MEKLFIVLDISNESIGGTLYTQNFHADPTILYSLRLPIIWEQPATSVPLLIKIRHTLQQVVKNLHDTGIHEARKQGVIGSQISKVFVTYASPWYLSQTKGVIAEYSKPTLITKKVLHDIIVEEEKQFLAEIQAHTHSELYTNVQIIERRIVDVKLNGYSTKAPYNKKAEKIELSIHASFVSKDILLITTDAIDQYFHCRKISYFSYPLVAYSTITHTQNDTHDTLIVDIRGETTDISLIKTGVLWETASFPHGSGALLRAISEKTNTSLHIAHSLLHIYYQKKPLPEVVLSMQPALKNHTDIWSPAYLQALKDITTHSTIPKKIYLMVEPPVEKYFVQLFKQIIPETQVVVVHGYDFKDHITGVVRYPDTPLAVELYFASILK